MSTYSKITIIYNPVSTGSSEELARKLLDQIKTTMPELSVELIGTEYASHAEELAYAAAMATEHPLIVASSGDGGYHEVVNGLMKARGEGSQATAGLVPAGNANDHYHHMHDQDIIERIKNHQESTIDLLKFEGQIKGKTVVRYAHSYIGMGLTPQVGAELNKTDLNVFKEVAIVGKALLNNQAVKLRIKGRLRRYDSVICSNISKMSKVLRIADEAHPNDGRFELTLFRQRNRLKLISRLLRTATTGLRGKRRRTEFMFETVEPTLIQLDGEIMELDAQERYRIRIAPDHLQCIV
ncbi:MAG: diacylglycerol kinase catalytic region [Candidatus Saccharibacteria bacterium]|nr:diacylglycerol kinase catalytic region [Candidatus Saccharibacteria bacterium]